MKEVTITASGERTSGKSTLLRIAAEAFKEAGYRVSPIATWGDEVITEEIIVTTAIMEVVWLNKNKV